MLFRSNSRKWHLSPCIFAALPPARANVETTPDAYYTQESFESLRTIDDYPVLASIVVPPNQYVCARNNGARRNVRGGGAPVPPPPTGYGDGHHSPAPSSSSSTESLLPPPPPLPLMHSYSPDSASPPDMHAEIPPAAAPPRSGAFAVAADRRLAPLEYLQNISPRARNPADDEALRQFQYTMSPL